MYISNLGASKCNNTNIRLQYLNTAYLVVSCCIPLDSVVPMIPYKNGCQNPHLGSCYRQVEDTCIMRGMASGNTGDKLSMVMTGGWFIIAIPTLMGILWAWMSYLSIYNSKLTNYFTVTFHATRGINHQQDGDVPAWSCSRLRHT